MEELEELVNQQPCSGAAEVEEPLEISEEDNKAMEACGAESCLEKVTTPEVEPEKPKTKVLRKKKKGITKRHVLVNGGLALIIGALTYSNITTHQELYEVSTLYAEAQDMKEAMSLEFEEELEQKQGEVVFLEEVIEEYQSEKEELDTKIEELGTEILLLEETVEEVISEKEQVANEKSKLASENAQLEREVATLGQNITRLQQARSRRVGGATVSEADRRLLAQLIYSEARGESRQGQRAVVDVVLNRLGNPNFGNSVSNVIMAPGQFDEAAILHTKPVLDAHLSVVAEALNGSDITNGALFFMNSRTASAMGAAWQNTRSVTANIGSHTFSR